MLAYFNKISHPANFAFPAQPTFELTDVGGDVHRIQVRAERPWQSPSQATLATSIQGESRHRVIATLNGTLTVTTPENEVLLTTPPGAGFGRSGEAWLLQFRLPEGLQFYGLGEHSRGFEKSGQRAKFWNTDLIADFAWDEVRLGYPNPMYVAMPWLIVKRGNTFLGLLVHHPGEVFMELGSNFIWDKRTKIDRSQRTFYVGAPDGDADLYLIVGPSLPELTRKLQTLVGRTPLPPLWSLGYHQCRWGYAGPRDLKLLDREMRRRRIPCDGLWLDIDYMNRLKVFTFAPEHWGSNADVRRELAALRANGRRVAVILDPGVKVEPGYHAYQDGLAQDVFCRNRIGKPYVGFVWPGPTHFPDFSLPEVRAWWAGYVAEMVRTGVSGFWIDMNDPSTGAAEMDDMLFGRGQQPHESYHNQYALGMAEATRAGLLQARPEERPFQITRSAYISSSRHTAVWTGDNLSNWHHLQLAIPISLGLSMSGFPFCGPDVCGFGLDATRELAIAWHKMQFLFPFFRNHSALGVREQEPWKFGASAERILTHYIRLRYKFIPYLYQLFIAQEHDGDPLLRPLFHAFRDSAALPLGQIGDQFLVGPAVMQAPVLTEDSMSRSLALPGRQPWYSLTTGEWHHGGRRVRVTTDDASTPVFVRDGSLLPLQPGLPETNETDLRRIELHVVLRADSHDEAVTVYHADDGASFGYQRGERTSVEFRARRLADGTLELRARSLAQGYGPLRVVVVDHSRAARLRLEGPAGRVDLRLASSRWRASGVVLRTTASPEFEL